jgi:hypothetical protein
MLDNTPIPILTPVQFGFYTFVLVVERTGASRFYTKNEFVPVDAFQTDMALVLSIRFSDPNDSIPCSLSSMIQHK